MKYDGPKKLKESDYHNLLYKEPFKGTDLIHHTARKAIGNGMPDHKWSDSHKEELHQKIKKVYSSLSNHLANNSYIHIGQILKEHGL
jgi:hypothetical protein